MLDFLDFDNMTETTLLYLFSTISQTLAALIAVVGVIVVFRMQGIDNHISRILSKIVAHQTTFENKIYSMIEDHSELNIILFNEPITDLYQLCTFFKEKNKSELYPFEYKSLMYLSGLIDRNFFEYKRLCFVSLFVVFISIVFLVFSHYMSKCPCMLNASVVLTIILVLFVLYLTFRNLSTLFISANMDRSDIILEREMNIDKILKRIPKSLKSQKSKHVSKK